MKDISELNKLGPAAFKATMRELLTNSISWPTYQSVRDLTVAHPPKSAGSEGAEWQPPMPFQEYDLPEFPVDMFCQPVREFMVAIAAETQTPIPLAGTSVIPALSAATQGKVEVQANQNWSVTLSTYTATVLESGSGKTPVHERAAQPILEYEEQLREGMAEQVASSQSEKRLLEKEREHAERKAAAAKTSQDYGEWREKAKEAAIKLKNLEVVYDPQLVVDDATAEALVQVLAEQQERAFAFASEGDVLNILRGRYSDGQPNFKIWLAGFDGSPIIVNRKSTGLTRLRRPAISMGLTFQPSVLRDIRKTPQFDDQGLVPRMWFSIPPSKVGYRNNNAPVMSKAVYANYAEVITRLLKLPQGKDDSGKNKPHRLTLSPQAREAYEAYFLLNEEEMREGGFQENMLRWASKFGGAMMKMAGLLHLSDHYKDERPWELFVDADVIHRAAELRQYFKHHAKAAYGVMKADWRIDDAKYLLSRILSMNAVKFSRRDLFEKTKGKFGTVKRMQPGLELLVEHNYIREVKAPRAAKRGRRPSQMYEVNPEVLKTPSHNSHKSNSANNASEGGDKNA